MSRPDSRGQPVEREILDSIGVSAERNYREKPHGTWTQLRKEPASHHHEHAKELEVT